jgi:hypothetical protein
MLAGAAGLVAGLAIIGAASLGGLVDVPCAGGDSAGIAAAFLLWPVNDPSVLPHIHKDLPPDHPHVRDARQTDDGSTHAHRLVIEQAPSPLARRGATSCGLIFSPF